MRRREFVSLLGGAAVWPAVARAQQAQQDTKRIGVLMTPPEGEPEITGRLVAFRQRLQTLGWTEGRNLRTDVRWDAAKPERARLLATELLSYSPDLMLVGNTVPMAAVAALIRTVPVLFAMLSDPVETGFAQSFAHPGGNITGFTNFEHQTAESGSSCSRKSRRGQIAPLYYGCRMKDQRLTLGDVLSMTRLRWLASRPFGRQQDRVRQLRRQ